tara:strand:+ start:776 stop:1033 length:258 start_codon:yes stop_codon:yes gene_type:complete
MTDQDIGGHDFTRRQDIIDSCRVIKSHASFIGVSATEIHTMPQGTYAPVCMDELNEAAGVLQRALDRIENAKQVLLNKPALQAAE